MGKSVCDGCKQAEDVYRDIDGYVIWVTSFCRHCARKQARRVVELENLIVKCVNAEPFVGSDLCFMDAKAEAERILESRAQKGR